MTRVFDILFSFIAIVIFFPFMLPIVIGLLLTGEHHVFYLQPRCGRHGKEFKIIKFATMLKDSPNLNGGFITQENDPRILPLGRFLRKTKINELPQLLNIFIGEMSIVGPRPIVRKHLELYPATARKVVESMQPGLTGIGSLVFRDEEGILNRMQGDRKHNHDMIIAPFKSELEVWFSTHKSLATYFIIIFLTAWSLIKPGDKVYKKRFKDLPIPPKELIPFIW